MFRVCPMCKREPLLRSEVKTCGARECLRDWRRLSVAMRARAVADAELIADALLEQKIARDPRSYKYFTPTELPTFHKPAPEDLDKAIGAVNETNEVDKEFLSKRMTPEQIDKLFGGPPPKKTEDDEK